MTDPRYTDPKSNDPLRDPGVRRDQSIDRMWGWIAGIAVAVLIGFILIAGWNSNRNTASNGTAPATTGSAPTTGTTPAPPPAAPRPATPAPSGSQ